MKNRKEVAQKLVEGDLFQNIIIACEIRFQMTVCSTTYKLHWERYIELLDIAKMETEWDRVIDTQLDVLE